MPIAKHSADRAHAGDLIEVHPMAVGRPGRRGQILEILGEPDHEHYRVRWDDQHESILYPADGGARIITQREPPHEAA